MQDNIVGWNSSTWRYKVKCAGCGRTFEARRRDARSCSATCRKRVSRADDQRHVALKTLLLMAGQVDEICKRWPESQEILDQVQLLAASARASAATIKPPWKPLTLPLELPAPSRPAAARR